MKKIEKGRAKQKLYKRDPNCHWCKQPTRMVSEIRNKRTPDDVATLDHITPRCFGGTLEQNNLVLCCKRCNSLRMHYSSPQEAVRINMELLRQRIEKLLLVKQQRKLEQSERLNLLRHKRKLKKYETLAEELLVE